MKRSPAGRAQESPGRDRSERYAAPLYYFWGDEEFLIDEEVDLIVRDVLKEGERGFNLDIVEGGEIDPRELASLAATFPMMANRRVVVVKGADRLEMEGFRAYLAHPSETTVAVFVSYDPDKRKTAHRELMKFAESRNFRKLKDGQLPEWIMERARKLGYRVEPAAAAILAEFAGSALREIQNELDKLCTYARDRKTITGDDVQLVSGMSKEFNIFELQKAVGKKDGRRSTEILERLIDGGQHPIRINTMLGSYFMKLRALSDVRKRGVPETSSGVPPFLLTEYRHALTLYTDDELEHALLEIARADEKLKGSSYSARQILEFTTASIMSGEPDSSVFG